MKGIRVSVTNETWVPGKLSFKDTLSEEDYDRFLKYISLQLRNELKRSIDTQRYKRKWSPLSFKYFHYKETKGLSLKIWEATSHLKNNIVVYKKDDWCVVGFKSNAVYPNSGVKINFIAKTLEYGSPKNHLPPRPLFRLMLSYMRKNVSDYYVKFEKEHGINGKANANTGSSKKGT